MASTTHGTVRCVCMGPTVQEARVQEASGRKGADHDVQALEVADVRVQELPFLLHPIHRVHAPGGTPFPTLHALLLLLLLVALGAHHVALQLHHEGRRRAPPPPRARDRHAAPHHLHPQTMRMRPTCQHTHGHMTTACTKATAYHPPHAHARGPRCRCEPSRNTLREAPLAGVPLAGVPPSLQSLRT